MKTKIVFALLVLFMLGGLLSPVGAADLIDSYSESNYSGFLGMRAGSRLGVGQWFLNTTSATLDSCTFYAWKYGSPTGSVYARLYARQGTDSTTWRPTGSALASSDALDVSSLGTSPALVGFTFSGADRITLSASTNYVICVEYTGGDADSIFRVGMDSPTPTHSGNSSHSYDLSTPTWSAIGTTDIIFYIFSEEDDVVVTPSAATADATGVNPTVWADVVVAPTRAEVDATAVNPTVLADAIISPTRAEVDATAVNPNVPGTSDAYHVYADSSETYNLSVFASATSPGDTVIIHPGEYAFCVVLSSGGSVGNPIVIRGSDPNDRPVFDLSAYESFQTENDTYHDAVDNDDYPLALPWAGGDWGAGAGIAPHTVHGWWSRGVFTIWSGGYISIEDIEFTNAFTYGASNAIRVFLTDNGPINITRCKATYCDNGLDVMVEPGYGYVGADTVTASYCEFAYNGRRFPDTSPGGHNIYTHGGALVLEHCYIHGAVEGQNLHLGSKRATIRYCWLEEPYSYHTDMSSYPYNSADSAQVHTYIGNVFVDSQGPLAVSNNVFVVMQNNLGYCPSQTLSFYYNTFFGTGDSRHLVAFSGEGAIHAQLPSLYMYNNIIYGNAEPIRLQYTGEYDTISIEYNWWPGEEGDYTGYVDSSFVSFANNVFGVSPGFVDSTGGDYALTDTSMAIDEADSTLGELPAYEYDDTLSSAARTERADLGAYEAVDSVSVTPSAATVEAIAVNPTVYSDEIAQPSYASVEATAGNPTVWTDDTVYPSPAIAVATARGPLGENSPPPMSWISPGTGSHIISPMLWRAWW